MRRILVVVVSLMLWTAARSQTVYEPEPDEEYEVFLQERCVQTLEHPSNSTVHLFEYEIEDLGDSFFILYTNDSNTDNHTESCLANFVDPTNRTDTRPLIFITESGTCHDVLFFDEGNPVVCLYFTIHDLIVTIDLAPAVTTLVLASLSVLASSLLLVTHIIFPSLRTLPSKVIMNLAGAFLAGDLCIIVQTSMVLEEVDHRDVEIVVVISFYFFYARFMWMALAGFEMCRTIHVGTQLRFDSEKKRMKIFLGYVILGWTAPAVPTIIMAIVHFENLENKDFGEGSLFGIGGYIITLLPVGVAILFNIGIVGYLTYVLFQAHRWQVKVSSAISAQKRKTNFAQIFLIIVSILGFSWILVFLLFIDGVSRSVAVQVIVSILNTSQPIFVCIAFVFTKKIALMYLSLCSGGAQKEDPSAVPFNRFRNRRLLSFLFTDRELEKTLPKYRFKRGHRSDSKISTTSVTMLSRDSSHSIGAQSRPSNGSCSPPNGLAPITEEEEQEPEQIVEESPSHVAVDIKDSSL